MQKTSWVIATIVLFVNSFLLAAEYFLFSKYSVVIPGAEGAEWNWGWAVFFTQLLYIFLSFRIVGPTELGAMLFFGDPVREVSSGLVFIPFGICQLEKETRLVIQEEFPADPEHIFREEGKVSEGMFPPIRIPFADKQGEDDPLSRRITAEVVPIVRYRIKDYIIFLTTIGSRKEAKKQMEDATIALCMGELTKLSVAEALLTLQDFSQRLKKEIDDLVEDWGIEVETAQIKAINFHHALNKAISGLPEARFQAKAVVEKAEGEKKKRILEGEGTGNAEKAVLSGRTAGLKKMAEELAIDASIVLGAETARAITENPGQKTIVVGANGFKEIIGIATAIGQAVKLEKNEKGEK